MAELVTIEAGMGSDTSIPTLNSNYKNLNDELATGGPTATKTVTVNSASVKGSVTFSRQGGLVVVNGYVSTVVAPYDGFLLAASDVPAGYANTRNTPAACAVVSDAHAYLGSEVTGNSSGIKVKTTNELSTNKSTDSGSWSLVYPTDDDSPTA